MIRTIIIWCALFLLQAIVVILVVPPNVFVNAAYQEEAILEETLGPEAAESISAKARDTFHSAFVDTGIMAESFTLFVPTEASKRRSSGMETLSEGLFETVRRRLESLWNLVFVGIQRAYAFAAWLPLLLPFVIAAAFDGATIRRVKLLTFGMSSAPLYGVAMHVLILLIFFPLFYAAWPFSVPPLLVPLWYLAFALVLRLLISNLQRM